MKVNLSTKLFGAYSPFISNEEWQKKKAEREAEEKKQQELEQFWSAVSKMKSIVIGTTPNFVIDLNPDMLSIGQIDQVTVTFVQNNKVVQYERLFHSDNYTFEEAERNSEGHIIPVPPFKYGEWKYDEDELTNHTWEFDSEGFIIPYKNTIRNPKFTYDKVMNHLVLTLNQHDTLHNFEPTNWFYGDSGTPFYKNNPTLVMAEVKIKLRHDLGDTVIIRPQEYIAVADTIENSVSAARPIFREHRRKLYFGSYAGNGYKTFEDTRELAHDDEDRIFNQLPQRIEVLKGHKNKFDWKYFTTESLIRDGLVYSPPVIKIMPDSEGNYDIPEADRGPENIGRPPKSYSDEVLRYMCIAIPITMKVKLKAIKVLHKEPFGTLDFISGYKTEDDGFIGYETNSEGYALPATGLNYPAPGMTLQFNSVYLVDPQGVTEDNPSGEYILWYTKDRFYEHYVLKFLFEDIMKGKVIN